MKNHELDAVDRTILNILQRNAKCPLKEIAEKVYLSTPAVSARIEKMEKEGYILGYQAQVNPEALGYHIKALINLEVSPEEKNVFYPFVRKCSNVIECNCVTGENILWCWKYCFQAQQSWINLLENCSDLEEQRH